ncbi:pilus assembly protein [Vibrio sp. T187]|uniref:TadE/TadG family type IV pilus assembly protein n=1 Tax=Vibrio TaxID=662 RepID=UPI0010CA0595|nr:MULTISPECIES: TadE/TadG family type IV pilus assembly protein [Vibrio]MBW3696781.1 pilus assembly protein [Vibrio sp. T187]
MKPFHFGFRQKRSKNRGLAIVEFTIVATVFLFVLFAIVEGARFIYSNGVVTHYAREGARYASVRGAQAATDTLRKSDAPATETSVGNYVNQSIPLQSVTTTVTWSPDNSLGSEVSVTVSYEFQSLLTIFNSVTISNSATSIIYF